MKVQAVPSFIVDGKWLNNFCGTMKKLGSSFSYLVLTHFFALMHPTITRFSRVSCLKILKIFTGLDFLLRTENYLKEYSTCKPSTPEKLKFYCT